MMILYVVVLGLCLGSFVNALVWRIRKQMEDSGEVLETTSFKRSRFVRFVVSASFKVRRKLRIKRAGHDKYSILKGRSMCPRCEHELAAKDLVPVFSWIFLKGKCRYCKKPISAEYPIVELVTTLLFVASYAFWPTPLYNVESYLFFGFWLVLLTGFVALALYDLKWFLLPNRIVFPLMAIAVVQVLIHVFVFDGGMAAALSAVWGVVIGSGVFYVIYRVAQEADREWIGFGDVKLGIVLGLVVGGPWNSIFLLFLSSLLGTLVSIPLLINKKAKRTSLISYGPFLIAAAIIIQLFGATFQAWFDKLLV